MERILQVYPQLNNAGTERVIMNLYENIDREKIQFDFLVEHKGELDEVLKSMGAKIYYLYETSKKDYYNSLIKFFNENKQYKIVHTHTHSRMGIVLKAAKRCEIPCRIAHSHNARIDLPKAAQLYKKITSRSIEKNATLFFACSKNAAKWLFPSKYKECNVIYNGINLEKFKYNIHARNEIRRKYNIKDNQKVICHVGRFAKQKNHEFLIDISSKIIDKESNAILFLVGVGPLEGVIKKKVKQLKLNDNVKFFGNRTDVFDILSASDVFVLPSIHEGLGIVAIEAQANGMSCLASESIPIEADIGINLLERISLKKGPNYWANKVNFLLDEKIDRDQKSLEAMDCSYDIKKIAKKVENIYLSV